MNLQRISAPVLAALLLLAACKEEVQNANAEPVAAPQPIVEPVAAAAPAPKPAPKKTVCADCGTVTAVEQKSEKGSGSGAGALAGAVIGGVIGHQFGDGSGKKAATAAGAIGGAIAGNEVEKRAKASSYYEVQIAMDNGGSRTLKLADATGISPGTKVRVVGENLELVQK